MFKQDETKRLLLTSSMLFSNAANLESGLRLRISAEKGDKLMLWPEADLIGDVPTVVVCALILCASAN